MSAATFAWLVEMTVAAVKAVMSAVETQDLSEEQQMRLAELAYEVSALKRFGEPRG